MGLVKALSDFYGNRLIHCFYQTAQNRFHQLGIFHQGRAFPVVYHLGYRTAHIDVQNGKGTLLYPLRHLTDNLRVRAEQLQGNRLFFRMNLHQTVRIFVVVIYGFCTDHFHTHKSCPQLAAQQTKWQV